MFTGVPVTTFCSLLFVDIPSRIHIYFNNPENIKIPKNIISQNNILFDNPGFIVYYFGIFYLPHVLQLVLMFIINDLLKGVTKGCG